MNTAHDDNAVFNIGTAARRSGLSVTTIRTWEDRYGSVVPRRDASGRRLYSEHQIAQLRWLRRQVESGLQAAEAHRLLEADTEAMSPARSFETADATRPGLLMMEWIETERPWLSSMLGDLSTRLGAEAAAIGCLIANPLYGPILSMVMRAPEPQGEDPVRRLAAVLVADFPALAEGMTEGSVITVDGGGPLGRQRVVAAPLMVGGEPAGVLALVDPTASDPEALIGKAARVIEARMEADRARSAFAQLLE